MRIALVIPCFDEARRLDVAALLAARAGDHALDLVLVDDGSRDGTLARLEQVARARPGSRVVRLPRNLGKAEAVRHGVLDALARGPDAPDRPDAIGYWDADLSTPLSELSAFADVLAQRPEVRLVYGSRVMLMGRRIERLAWRHYLGRAFATAASLTLSLPVYDTQCGAKLLRADALCARVFERPMLTRWVFDVEIIARYMALDPAGPAAIDASLYELPLTRWSHAPGSKVRPLDFLGAAADLARVRRVYLRG